MRKEIVLETKQKKNTKIIQYLSPKTKDICVYTYLLSYLVSQIYKVTNGLRDKSIG